MATATKHESATPAQAEQRRDLALSGRSVYNVRLVDGQYVSIERSGFLPDLDFALIARLAARTDQDEALQELRGILEVK